MVLSDPDKSGLESGAWVDGYDFENKGINTTCTITKNKSLLFFPCSVS